jgi:hypothetical protein
MPNYGDVALRLDASWSRAQYENQELMMLAIGHADGTPDVYKTEAEEEEYQFAWVDPKDAREVSTARMRGYEFVTKDEWTKHEFLWNWDAQGRVEFGSLNLMARPKERWLADQAKVASLSERARKDSDADVARLPEGLVSTKRESRRRAGI